MVDTPLEVQGTPPDSGAKETTVQAIAERIPEDQKDEDQDWCRWHMGWLLGSETALEEEANTTQRLIRGRLFDFV